MRQEPELPNMKAAKLAARRIQGKMRELEKPDFGLSASYEVLAACYGFADWQSMRGRLLRLSKNVPQSSPEHFQA